LASHQKVYESKKRLLSHGSILMSSLRTS
jgi:hypothetical protein